MSTYTHNPQPYPTLEQLVAQNADKPQAKANFGNKNAARAKIAKWLELAKFTLPNPDRFKP